MKIKAFYFFELKKKVQKCSPSLCITYTEWAFFLCLANLSYFLSVDQIPTLYLLCFQYCEILLRVLLTWSFCQCHFFWDICHNHFFIWVSLPSLSSSDCMSSISQIAAVSVIPVNYFFYNFYNIYMWPEFHYQHYHFNFFDALLSLLATSLYRSFL